ncbi:MAG: hypothetical protein GWP91_23430 [Rhodobacterales bacterium]|nr:hypothetical protein [Rhodobacterales bacterium]
MLLILVFTQAQADAIATGLVGAVGGQVDASGNAPRAVTSESERGPIDSQRARVND